MADIQVHIGLHGELRARFPDRAQHQALTLSSGATVASALAELGHEREAWLVSRNGTAVSRQENLRDGDRLDIYPFIEGG